VTNQGTRRDEDEMIPGSIAEWPRSDTERLAVTIGDYQGKRFASVRIFYRDHEGAWRPSTKGTSVRRRELRGVIEALEQAERELSGGDR